jgi:IS30 family transposase
MKSHKLTDEHKKKILKAIAKGIDIPIIATECGVHRNSIYDFMRRNPKDTEMAQARYESFVRGIFS